MAFTTRSVRGPQGGSGATGPTVGPGTYRERDFDSQKVRFSSAPFSSSTERSVSAGGPMTTPGPGSYIHHGDMLVKGPDLARKSSQFASKAPRLLTETELPKKALTPGPGAYRDVRAEPWVPASQTVPASGGSSRHAINWIKVATAPSIPAPSQSYGYEEGVRGELIQQRAPQQGHAGKGGDTVGPGEYEPRDGMCRSRMPVAEFGRSRSGRASNVPKDAGSRPGPGAYEAKTSVGQGDGTATAKSTCVFASSTVRQFVNPNEAALPGPGTYTTPSQFKTRADFLASQQAPADRTAFGTTLSAPLGKREGDQPGPGAYTAPSSFNKEASRWNVNHGAFSSTSVRFGEAGGATTEKFTPGPGFYTDGTERTALSAQLSRRIAGRYGVFGTTAQRFPVQQPKVTVGPGSYNPPDKVNPAEIRKRDLRQACFLSNVERKGIVQKAQEETPGVGSYEAKTAFGPVPTGMRTEHPKGTNDLEPRFRPERPTDLTPGPGHYESTAQDLAAKVFGGVVVTDRRGRMGKTSHRGMDRTGNTRPVGDRSLRFPSRKTDTPGPGQYDATGTLIKKTFNITIGDTWD
eukprot:Hpha_TRINITY_DN15483_c0_g4::TRINITY_DN15483_c0_g4_i1::g.176349::m.176349